MLYNANEVADTGVYLINLDAYDISSSPKIVEDEDTVQKVTLHGEDDPVLLDGQVLVDKMMQAIAVTTTENQLILHKINLENGKFKAKKRRLLSHERIPNQFQFI